MLDINHNQLYTTLDYFIADFTPHWLYTIMEKYNTPEVYHHLIYMILEELL